MPGGSEWIIIGIVVLVLFGGSQLPKLARSLGEARKEFEKGTSGDADTPAGETTADKGPTA
jgi:sec-independent protein translocase protein TatA